MEMYMEYIIFLVRLTKAFSLQFKNKKKPRHSINGAVSLFLMVSPSLGVIERLERRN